MGVLPPPVAPFGRSLAVGFGGIAVVLLVFAFSDLLAAATAAFGGRAPALSPPARCGRLRPRAHGPAARPRAAARRARGRRGRRPRVAADDRLRLRGPRAPREADRRARAHQGRDRRGEPHPGGAPALDAPRPRRRLGGFALPRGHGDRRRLFRLPPARGRAARPRVRRRGRARPHERHRDGDDEGRAPRAGPARRLARRASSRS